MYKNVVLKNRYIRIDTFGRVFFDTCETDLQHMNAQADKEEDRRRCRVYLEDLVPRELVEKLFANGGKVRVQIEVTIEEEER